MVTLISIVSAIRVLYIVNYGTRTLLGAFLYIISLS